MEQLKHARIRNAVITVAVMGAYAGEARAETITLKNGTVLKGTIEQMTEADVTIVADDIGKLLVKRSTIQSINNSAEVSQGASTAAGSAGSPAGSDNSAPMLSGSLGVGLGEMQFMLGTTNFKIKDGPAVHWDVLNYRFYDGLSFGIVGDGIQNSRKNGEYATLLMGGASLGWKSTSPILGFSGNVYSAAIVYGRGQLKMKRKGKCDLPGACEEPTELPDVFEPAELPAVNETFSGPSAGLNLGFSRFYSSGVGSHLGFSANQAWLTRSQSDCQDPYFNDHMGPDGDYIFDYRRGSCRIEALTVTALAAYGGLSYSF